MSMITFRFSHNGTVHTRRQGGYRNDERRGWDVGMGGFVPDVIEVVRTNTMRTHCFRCWNDADFYDGEVQGLRRPRPGRSAGADQQVRARHVRRAVARSNDNKATEEVGSDKFGKLMTRSCVRPLLCRLGEKGIPAIAGPVSPNSWGGHEKGWTVYLPNGAS